MTRRTSRLISLLTLIAPIVADRDTKPARDQMGPVVSEGIDKQADQTKTRKSIVRRDVIFQNGYAGQDEFGIDVWDAFHGKTEGLLSHVRTKDTDAVRACLSDLKPHFATTGVDVGVGVEAPDTDRPKTSAEWLDEMIREKGLIQRLTKILSAKAPREDYEEHLSLVGYWIAKWGHDGTFDKALAEKGKVPMSVLCQWIKQKHTSGLSMRGQEPLHRMRGARTQKEIGMRREADDGQDHKIESSVASALLWDTAIQCVDDEDSGDANWNIEVIDPHTPDSLVAEALDAAVYEDEGRRLVAASYRSAVDRYTRIFDQLIAGADRNEIAKSEGVTPQRAGQLAQRVRNALRDGPETRAIAGRIMTLLADEPYSTREEIQHDLRIDFQRFSRAIAYLADQDLVVSTPDDCYALRRA